MTQQPQTEKIGGRQLVDCRALPQNLITEPGKAAMLDFERGVLASLVSQSCSGEASAGVCMMQGFRLRVRGVGFRLGFRPWASMLQEDLSELVVCTRCILSAFSIAGV